MKAGCCVSGYLRRQDHPQEREGCPGQGVPVPVWAGGCMPDFTPAAQRKRASRTAAGMQAPATGTAAAAMRM